MTICTPHSYAGPKECPYCRIAVLEKECEGHIKNYLELNEGLVELETEVQQLKAELRQYQPSDGMMYKLLGLNDMIREAARIFELLKLGKPGFERLTLADLHNWLEHPVVVRAVNSPMAQAKVKP